MNSGEGTMGMVPMFGIASLKRFSTLCWTLSVWIKHNSYILMHIHTCCYSLTKKVVVGVLLILPCEPTKADMVEILEPLKV